MEQQTKRYRAVLTGVAQKHTETGLAPVQQCFSNSCGVLKDWGKDILKGYPFEQFPQACVTIYEQREVLVGTVVPEPPKEKKKETHNEHVCS